MASHGKIAKASKATAPVVDIVKTITALKADIKQYGIDMQDIKERTHRLACSVLHHTAKNGRIQVLEQFLDAVPDMVRKNSLQTWFETYGQLTFVAANDAEKGLVKGWKIDRSKKLRLGEAMEKPFWKIKGMEGVAYVPMDAAKAMEKLIKQLEGDMEKAKKAGIAGVDHTAMIAALKGYKNGGATAH